LVVGKRKNWGKKFGENYRSLGEERNLLTGETWESKGGKSCGLRYRKRGSLKGNPKGTPVGKREVRISGIKKNP